MTEFDPIGRRQPIRSIRITFWRVPATRRVSLFERRLVLSSAAQYLTFLSAYFVISVRDKAFSVSHRRQIRKQ